MVALDATLTTIVELTTRPQTASLDSTQYDEDITDHGLEPAPGTERIWTVYPARTAVISTGPIDVVV